MAFTANADEGQNIDSAAVFDSNTVIEQPEDSSTSQRADTLVNDTLNNILNDTLNDTLNTADSLLDEELTQDALDEKYRQHQEEKARRLLPRLSVFDSLVNWFASPRLNRRDDIDRSFYHDAGDYFHSDPSFFVLEHQVTPMRTTVQPFGVSGNHLNLLIDGNQFQPFEHIPEPDGYVDLNDIPTALNSDVFVLPGPVGQVFGGSNAIASLVTRPKPPDSYRTETSLLVDKGGFEYSFVRGRYSKKFTDGRLVDASVGYRKADGPTLDLQRESDSYHYYADMFFPLKGKVGFRAWGQLYDSDGPLVIRPNSYGATIKRNKFDRSARLSFTLDDSAHTSQYEIGYKHLRQGSYLTGESDGRFDKTGHGLFAQRQWLWGRKILSARIDGDYLEYDQHLDKYKYNRQSGEALLQIGWLHKGWRWAASVGSAWVEEYQYLPRVAGVLFREGDKSLIVLSVGYSERAPTLHELHLRFQESEIYGSGTNGYADGGNDSLTTEKQFVGNLTCELGSLDNRIHISVTKGRITDGINWSNELVVPDSSSSFFHPENGDVMFTSVMVQPRVKIRDFLTFVSGASYQNTDYQNADTLAYTPEYQVFSGLELHYFWRQKLMDLFAYGEIMYVGPYNGYDEKELGSTAVVNAKLSFALKDYRMHFVFQNVFANQYYTREGMRSLGRYFYYGFTWNFLD